MIKNYFPLKLALGEQFCNREKERILLKDNITQMRPTVLVSPRRYGKSSLMHKVVSELNMPFASIDLFLAHDGAAVAKRITQGVAEVVSQIIPVSEKFLESVQKFFRNFKVTLSVGSFNIEATYHASAIDSTDQIFTSLQALSRLAKEKQKQVVFFIDEFQDIANANNSKAIQGAIRHVAQESSNVVFVFSGSNRGLLLELFDNKSLPLYMMCDKLMLQRMSSESYWPFIQKAATERWGDKIARPVFERIITYTELHPFYVNFLCSELWKADIAPDIDAVTNAWEYCFEIEERRLIAEIEKLTGNQREVLKAVAKQPVLEPTAHQFLTNVGLAYSSVHQAMKVLFEKDMLYKVKNEDNAILNSQIGQIRVLDPLLAYALRKYMN
ncbi:MAG: ATP-binding protein [Gammaproteobacteria bacterium]|nr:ATP-binding protein [Gammaproteobacteria bacterium]